MWGFKRRLSLRGLDLFNSQREQAFSNLLFQPGRHSASTPFIGIQFEEDYSQFLLCRPGWFAEERNGNFG